MALSNFQRGTGTAVLRQLAFVACLLTGLSAGVTELNAQDAPAAVANRALGTVTSVEAGTLTIKTDAGAIITATLGSNVRVQQLAPGSTDLKTAEASTPSAIAVGDRVLVSGTSADGNGLTAARVILMKSTAIAQRNQSSQADWSRRGTGGIVTAVDAGSGKINLSSGTRKLTLDTTGATKFRRYAPGSVKFEEAKPGTLAEIHPGDQLRARGDRSTDGLTITAEEVVSGSFRNLSGTIVSVTPGANSLVIKDLATKKNETVAIGADSDLRLLPPEMAARFAPGRARTGAGTASGAAGSTGSAQSGAGQSGTVQSGASQAGAAASTGDASQRTGQDSASAGGGRTGGYGAGGGYGGAGRAPGAGGRTGADLSAMIPRLPKSTLADFKPGEALMIVASGSSSGPYTAITVLSGVEPLLTGPAGSEITLPPWSSTGGGGGEAGGAGPE